MLLEVTERTYRVVRDDLGVVATVDGYPLPLRTDLYNHNPNGFEFGYSGSGPAQLALAILADCIGDLQALEFYQDFKRAVIAQQQTNAFTLTGQHVRAAIVAIRSQRTASVDKLE